MTKTALGDATVAANAAAVGDASAARERRGGQRTPSRAHSAGREVAELVRHYSRVDGRHGFRVVARGVSGHIFFERGRVVHAEFGEDCGLRAVVEMLRSGPAQLEAASSWPSQPSLHLGPELLLSMTERDSSRVVRKVDLPVEPPPLPDPQARETGELVSPVHPGALRSGPRRAVSGVMPRVGGSEASDAADGPEPSDAPQWPAAAPATLRRATPRPAAGREPTPAPSRVSAPATPEAPASSRAAFLTGQRPPSELPITRAQRARSRSVAVARSAASAPKEPAPVARPSSGASSSGPSSSPSSSAPSSSRSPSAASAPRARGVAAPNVHQPTLERPTTMVRVASRGELLAARGDDAEQLAEAAAFIHGLASLIAADFGRQGRANVHLSGNGKSLLVARSEVNDIAAALGPTERISSLLGKVGFK
jgi:hypothetical protein